MSQMMWWTLVDLLYSQVSKESQGYEPCLAFLTCTEGSTASDLLAEALLEAICFGITFAVRTFVSPFLYTSICTFYTGWPFFSPNASPSCFPHQTLVQPRNIVSNMPDPHSLDRKADNFAGHIKQPAICIYLSSFAPFEIVTQSVPTENTESLLINSKESFQQLLSAKTCMAFEMVLPFGLRPRSE